MAEETGKVSMRVRIGDTELEVTGPREFVEAKIAEFEKKAKDLGPRSIPVQPPDSAAGTKMPVPDKVMSVGEFVRRLGLKKHTDLVVAFGYYLEKYSGATQFSAADINRCYYDAKLETSNTSHMITRNIKRGYVMEARQGRSKAKGKKSYTLTHTGEQFVARFLAKES